MNAVKIDKNRHKESNMKVSAEEENEGATGGKPCIDFQPGDRWQIKDEENNGNISSQPKTTRKRKARSRRRNNTTRSAKKDKVSTEVNGGVVEDHSDEDEGEITVEQNENIKDKDKIKQNCASPENTSELDKSELGCANGESHTSNRKRRRSPSNLNSESKKNKCDSSLDADHAENNSKQDSADAVQKVDKSKEEKEPVCSSDSSKEKEEEDKSKNKENGEKVEEPSTDQCASSVSRDSKNESSEVTSSDKDKPPSKKVGSESLIVVSDEESDNDIQVISSSSGSKRNRKEESDESKPSKSVADFSVSHDEETLMSAGFPYLISLQEKIKDLQPGSYKPVKFPHMGTLMLEENEVIIESPSLLVPLLIKDKDKFPTLVEGESEGATSTTSEETAKATPGARKNFFQSSVGQFLINLGASRVLEWYHRDVKKFKMKQTRKSGYNKDLEEEIIQHGHKHQSLKETNSPFSFRLRRCELCEFRTESAMVMEAHYMVPHMSSRREFKCNFCRFVTRDSKDIIVHFKEIHDKRAILEDQMSLHECLFCSFQSHLKAKVSVHMNRCKRNFIPTQNLSPPFDFEFPGVTTKPVTIADVIAHRRMLLGTSKGSPYPSSNQGVPVESLASAFARKKLASVLNMSGAEGYPDSPTLVKHLMGQQVKQGTTALQLPPGLMLTRPRARSPQLRQVAPNLQPRLATVSQSGFVQSIGGPTASQLASSGISITPVGKQDASSRLTSSAAGLKNITLTPISSAGNQVVSQKPGPPQPVALFTNVAGNDPSRNRVGLAQSGKVQANLSGKAQRLMAPYQRLNTPPSQVVKSSSGSSFVMCEICDSYIKDLDELRSHMNWVHKVKIHPKMLVSRPPLNCQKCQWRFFTDQGLERHLLGAHGLVTTNMQEMANKNQDGGRCIICGAVFTYKLVSHMTQVHKVTLKPAHLSYKCTVCTATFTLYRLFESHVYNVHSSSSKRSSEESSEKKVASKEKQAASAPPKSSAGIDTQKTGQKKEEKKPNPPERVAKRCQECNFVTEDMLSHIKAKHMKECRVKLCRIEKCQKCLYSSDEMLVIRLDQLGLDEDSSSDESSEEDNSSNEDKDGGRSKAKKEDS